MGSNGNRLVIRYECLLVLSFAIVSGASSIVLSGETSIESLIPKAAPDGWTLSVAPETFTRETLFEHIDGQADLFIQYGFKKSASGVYKRSNSSDDRIDLDIYDMGSPLNTFGIFSRFRHGGSPAGIGWDSSLTDQYAIFYKGDYFVVMQATEVNAPTLESLSKDIESRIADGPAPPKEIGYFPRNGLEPGSIEYFPDGLLGYQFLGRGFKASYVGNGGVATKKESDDQDFNLFLGIFENSQGAEDALKLFREHLSKEGKSANLTSTQFGSDFVIGTDPYHGKVIVTRRGSYLLGAIGFEQDESGKQKLSELINEMKSQ
ncbi:MAG: DUF6599 family protein [Desulfomonilaceae bacterium]